MSTHRAGRPQAGRILTTLDPRDRIQVVVFAYEAGIIHPGDERP